MNAEFSWPVRIYWEDTDAGGVVYHASYVRFLERGRTEFLRSGGMDQVRLSQDTGLAFVVREMTLDFLRPARLDDELLVTVTVKQRRSASILFAQEIHRIDGTPLLRATVRVACVELASMRPVAIPPDLFPHSLVVAPAGEP
ncbi:tol-pal system-associated acyl-CoA thioesterase [Pinirhizobacter soli]|uniref:tol-pal system-associated acyl-CoA thioesterase n=1 Tax=Pinirhizobacter soli TaxID=2786953 RepID=UPI002029E98B|nr:tol-pal system-associated acyl-CoA thioesterase [Pinirhizobacter soli]